MTGPSLTAIDIERATEQLRQERETFDQQKKHDNRWFILRLVMGYSTVVMQGAILVISSWIIFHASAFSPVVAKFAAGALFVDAVGLVASVWRGVLKPNAEKRLGPVTKAKLPHGSTGKPLSAQSEAENS
jgi:hypothetical protein